MKQVKILVLSLFIICNGQNVFSQSAQDINERVERERQQRMREERQLEIRNRQNSLDKKGFILNRDIDKEPRPPALYKGRKKEEENLKRAFEKTRYMLDVSETYYKKYKNVLSDEKAHLTRLQPDKNCYSKYVVSTEEFERCLDVIPISGGGSLYSFKQGTKFPLKTHSIRIEDNIVLVNKVIVQSFDKDAYAWNIHFANDKFIVQNNYTRGIISDIGDVDLSGINPTSKELEFLNDFKQKGTLAEVKEQSDALKKGVSFNNFIYSNTSPVKMHSTYVLRSLDYSLTLGQAEFVKRFPLKKQVELIKSTVDKRADLTIVFKVVGREDDGSVIILWKELKAGPLPIN